MIVSRFPVIMPHYLKQIGLRGVREVLIVLTTILILAGMGVWLSDQYVVPVIMYHKVEPSVMLRADTVSPENFKRQMEYLRQKGYQVILLDDLVTGIKSGRRFARNSVVLTFDDGYANNYTHAFSILREYQFPVTIFISPDFIGKEGFLDWRQIHEMRAGGIRYGSHGMSQAYLPDVDREEQIYEITRSKEILQDRLKEPIDHFCYPVGGFTDDVKKIIYEAGYEAALTTNRGHDRRNRDLFEIKRIRFSDKDVSGLVLWAKLSGYYNLFRKFKNPN
jgi:peptidoglycan/xylan/chitin deacetylase (PgdA/CDA1 family)